MTINDHEFITNNMAAQKPVKVEGMFGNGHTYFADSPVVIDISDLTWSSDGGTVTSPFTIVRVEVVYNNTVVGEFRADTGGQTSISFDISSALRAIWSGYDFVGIGTDKHEVLTAQDALTGSAAQAKTRSMREYSLRICTEYLSSDDGGVFTTTQCHDTQGNTDIPGGQCLIGGLTEWERYTIGVKENADVSHLEHSDKGIRNGDASTKPLSSPERVGRNSITSWVDVYEDTENGVKVGKTKTIFYPATYNNGQGGADDVAGRQTGWTGHAPLVLRDSIDYVDFLFVNRRGAVETCSGLMKEAMDIEVTTAQYARVERPTFAPSRSLMAIASGGRRSWSMSSGYQTREWAEWWAQEFLMARQWWMKYPVGEATGTTAGGATGTYVPVIVTPAKKSVSIYDKSKQQMPHVDFTVTLALEG